MKPLFTPFQIKSCRLENRIVMPGLASFLIEPDGSITSATVEHYRRRAAGGPGMVIMEACAISPEGIVSDHQARIYDDRFTKGLARIAAVMKSEGCVPAVQLHHGGRQTSARIIKQKPVAPSPIPCPTIRGEVEELTLDGIRWIITQFAESARRAFEAGFKLIEIHGAHGYLVNQFLSRFSNIREDEYGGDLSKRTRFAREVVQAVRAQVGPDFPLSFKISAQEFVPDGLNVEESIEILKLLVPAGIDLVQVSAGNDATPEWISQPMFMKKACLADSAAKIKAALDIPVMAVGRINHPTVANEVIQKEMADLVCMGRGLLADPDLPKKASQGRLDDIRTCIACNTCMESIFRRGRVECLVNPALGREEEMAIHPTQTPRKVMVIGGGPAGLNVAWVAAQRGHDVHLFEKTADLGGQLIPGSIPSYKNELHNLLRFLKRRVEQTGVHCHLEQHVNAAKIKSENPDVVILANGSVPFIPPVPGVEKPYVCHYNDVLNGDVNPAQKTVVIGGGATGCEVALHLAEAGSSVTIVEMLPKIGAKIESITKKVLFEKMAALNVEMLPGYKLSHIKDEGAVVCDAEGTERFLAAERIVIAIGARPDPTLYDSIKTEGYEIHRIGDCREPRSAKDAIYEGALLGRSL